MARSYDRVATVDSNGHSRSIYPHPWWLPPSQRTWWRSTGCGQSTWLTSMFTPMRSVRVSGR